MVLKGDSSMLVNRKPFFIPDWSTDVRMTPCVVVRVSRLGKNISARFANRYYDSMALGANIFAADYVAQGDWVRGFAFDYSLPVGEFVPVEEKVENLVIDLDMAVEMASKVMTLRQGDWIMIDRDMPYLNNVVDGKDTWPKAEDSYNYLCPSDPCNLHGKEKHRALADAEMEGHILLELYFRGLYRMKEEE